MLKGRAGAWGGEAVLVVWLVVFFLNILLVSYYGFNLQFNVNLNLDR